MHQVAFSRRAKKALDALPRGVGDRIAIAIAALGSEPRRSAEKLTGVDGLYRIRIGDYRVIYEINDAGRLVVVVKIAKRAEAYRGL